MTMEERFSSTDIVNGAEVFTLDGAKLGKVKEVSSDAFKVDAPMQPDYWLNNDTIDTCTNQAVTVNLTKGDLDQAKIKR
jgi:hypothetical protein